MLAGIGRETALGLQVLQKPFYPVLGSVRHAVAGGQFSVGRQCVCINVLGQQQAC